jgi:hypothetical protein
MPFDREAMHQFWDAALDRFKACVEQAQPSASSIVEAPRLSPALSDESQQGRIK